MLHIEILFFDMLEKIILNNFDLECSRICINDLMNVSNKVHK
jgi:hypothetical protein